MSEEPQESGGGDEAPDYYAEASGKGDVHIPGAGTIGMTILLVSLSILFIASMLAFVLIRVRAGETWAVGMPRVPNSLWLSTFVIMSASVTVHLAYSAIKRDQEKSLARYLLVTFIIGVIFLALQTFNWYEFYSAIQKTTRLEGAYLGGFFVLTGLHAAHVLGGLIPLGIVMYRASHGRYSRNFHPGVRYVAAYWHFLDAVWVILFSSIYF